MLRRAAFLGLALAFGGCTKTVWIHDVWDGGGAALGASNDAVSLGGTGIDAGSCPKSTYLGYLPIQPAQLWILLDRSSSMDAVFADTTRQAAVQAALKTTISKYEGSVSFGFEQFPASVNDPAADCLANKCCAGSLLLPTRSNWYDIKPDIQCDGWQNSSCDLPSPDSPSYAALAQVDDYYNKPTRMKPSSDGYILLVTSSDPSCAADTSNLCDQALSSAEDLVNNLDVRIVVIDVGSPPPGPDSCLDKISTIGSGLTSPPLPTGQSLYAVSSVADLTSAVDDVAFAIAQEACTVDLTNISIPSDHSQVVVSFDNGNIPVQPPDPSNPDGNGWSISSDNTRITFSGSNCTQIVDGHVDFIRIRMCNQ
jgi:hypothetical protein